MATNKNITMKQYNGTDYDTLYPKTTTVQTGASPSVLSEYYSSPSNQTADDILSKLSNTILASSVYIPSFSEQSNFPIAGSWRSVAYGNGKYVAGGSNTNIAYSTNGITWTQVSLPGAPSDALNVVFGGNKFIVYCSGYTAYSTDGINWVTFSSIITYLPMKIIYGTDKFVASYQDGGLAQRLAYSTDGITWTNSGLSFSYTGLELIYGNNIYIGYWPNAQITQYFYSTDGITWVEKAFTQDFSMWMSFGNGKFIGLSSQTGGTGRYSTDGLTWTTSSTNLTGGVSGVLSFGGGYFVTLDGGSVKYSTDGITWKTERAIAFNYLSYAYDRFFATSSNSATYIYSKNVVGQLIVTDVKGNSIGRIDIVQ